MFMLIYDKKQGRVIHYSSDPEENILSFFNEKCHREFYSNRDYIKMGGRKEDFPMAASEIDHEDQEEDNEVDDSDKNEPVNGVVQVQEQE